MACSSEDVLNGLEKAKLQDVLHNVEFVDMDEADQYKCSNCKRVALYHYQATCCHVFCAECYRRFYKKPCPLRCYKTTINEICQKLEFEYGIYQLKAYCAFRKNGCKEKMPLVNFLSHQKCCKFSHKKLLPKLWAPPHRCDSLCIKKIEQDVNNLKLEVLVLRDKNVEMTKKYNEILTINEQMEEKLKAISDQVKDQKSKEELAKEMNDTFIQEIIANKKMMIIIDEKLKQLTIDASFGISEQMNKNINLKIQELLKSLNLKFDDKSYEISKKLEKSSNSLINYFKTTLDEKAKAMNTLFSKDVSIVKQDLEIVKLTIEKHAESFGKNMSGHHATDKEKCNQENKLRDMKDWVYGMFNSTTEFHWRISKWPDVQKKGEDIFSDTFYTKDHSLKIRGKILFKDNYIYPWIDFVSPKAGSFVYYHRRIFEICIVKDGEETKKVQIMHEPGLVWDAMNAESLMEDCQWSKYSRCRFFDADFIDIRVFIEPLEILYKDYYSKNGILTWKLNKYSLKKRNGIEFGHSLWSEYFYDALDFRFKVYLKFHDDHVKLHLHEVYVDTTNLNMFRSYNLKTVILDQSGSKENNVKIEPNTNIFSHCRLASLSYAEIETSTYLKDDCIIIEVMLETC